MEIKTTPQTPEGFLKDSVAILLPCFNEELTIAETIERFQVALPMAKIYVYDNNSTDNTADISRSCGAIVRQSAIQGKGATVRKMFAEINADIYIMCDGDGTYPVEPIQKMLEVFEEENLDMLVGIRNQSYSSSESRTGHSFGNRMITALLNTVFGSTYQDVLSGYRIMSRRFVKSCPIPFNGFAIETLLTVHALEVNASIKEVQVNYLPRPTGSESKLNTFRDGTKILLVILYLFKEVKPLMFFGACSLTVLTTALLLGYPIITEFLDTGLVPRFPTAILSSALVVLSTICLACGLILDSVARQRIEVKQLFFQNVIGTK